MSTVASLRIRNDGLSHTTLRMGRGLSAASVAEVVRALQRVPGVLTVNADAENAQAFVAHDAGVPMTALVAAANGAGAAAKYAVAANAGATTGGPPQMQHRPILAGVGLVAMLVVVLIEIAFPNSPDKRWLFIMPVITLWAFMLLRATLVRRS